ncbi:Phospholipase/carboxylesterase/thioesterase [Choanephora cucurbitarum]|nr:Phospholipase/carboxylesterase/thioesterase [Choanephora cucurbitarum]
MSLTSVIISAKAKQTATVVWCHGLGDSGAGWSFIGEELGQLFPYVKWVLPNAPVRPIALNGGFPMPGWFDLHSLDKSMLDNEDEKGIMASSASINQLIQEEINQGIPAERIILGGFSQGACLSLVTGLSSQHKLGGVIACSGWLGLSSKFANIASDTNKQTPILMCHGDRDPVVRYEYGQESANRLKSLGYPISFKTYPGLVHSANEQELADIAQFIKKVIP